MLVTIIVVKNIIAVAIVIPSCPIYSVGFPIACVFAIKDNVFNKINHSRINHFRTSNRSALYRNNVFSVFFPKNLIKKNKQIAYFIVINRYSNCSI